MADLCNFRYDCNDKSDEESCPWQCTFDDNSMCSWLNEVKDNNFQPKTKWITSKGSINGPVLKLNNPQIYILLNGLINLFIFLDHTTNSPNGGFITIE